MTESAVLTAARERLARERARIARGAAPRVRPPPGVVWNPTPTRYENNVTAANPSAIPSPKVWDLSPVDPWAFDPTPGPLPGPPPVNTVLPQIQMIGGLTVGEQVVATTGTWTNGSTYARQWFRGTTPIAGETGIPYILTVEDVGLMISATVVASNPNGATAASAEAVGPITETRTAARKGQSDRLNHTTTP